MGVLLRQKMKSEEQVREKAKQLIEQHKQVQETNPEAAKIIAQRGQTLLWVLGGKDELLLSKEEIKFLACLW